MRFRPCIDIHNGKVKQIVGGSLTDAGNRAVENYVAEQDAAWFASLYRKDGLKGGHVILLNARDSEFYEATRKQAFSALAAWPGGLQAGGGIDLENAGSFLDAGASHVIVTSYVFREGVIRYDRLEALSAAVGREKLVLDLSCRFQDGDYRIVTDRWQTFTDENLTPSLMRELSAFCAEFLVHGVDREGKGLGVDEGLIRLLAGYDGIPVTYAGGIRNADDLEKIRQIGRGKIDVTIGSALDLFGGTLSYEKLAGQSAGGFL